jgi:hypothetical protein
MAGLVGLYLYLVPLLADTVLEGEARESDILPLAPSRLCLAD